MTRRQSIRILTYFTIIILTVALCGVLWPSGSSDVASAAAASAQDPLWQEIAPGSLDAIRSARQSELAPQPYKAFQLNEAALANLLADAPMESTEAAKDPQSEITLPMPDGAFVRFRFVESPIMAPELAAQFPDIKTYRGWGIDDPTATTRFDRTSDGFHAIVLSPLGAFYIAPLSHGATRAYASYFTRDAGGEEGLRCGFGLDNRATARPDGGATLKSAPRDNLLALQSANNSTGTTLRDFRLAVAATAEYTTAHGGTVARAMDAIARTINDVTAIYQRELAVCFTLVGNNASIIFTDPATDGYTSGDVGQLVEENQTKLNQVIGASNYDIGHVFDHNGNGISGLARGLVCLNSNKGKGASDEVTGPTDFVGIVAHEFGHQFGASHTFNGDCNSRHDDTAYEPGSGSTIMAYPGGPCLSGNNIQWDYDLYFHGTSLVAMAAFLNTCPCGGTTNNNNTPPHVFPPIPSSPTPLGFFLIPAQTPFTLTASATDAEDSDLTFCWEELDRGSPGPPNVDRVDNPLFRSWPPTDSPTRTFPHMGEVLSGTPTPGESLPTRQRFLKFRVTARDNRGGFDQADVGLDVWASAGPFAVTQPAAGTQALEGQWLTVTWDVAGTDVGPIRATAVRILLSTDNGDDAFPTTLAASTPNDGSFAFTVPRLYTERSRIKVEAIGNIFFNVSPAFAIIPKPTITATGSVTVTQGGTSVKAPVATVADERDAAGSLVVMRTSPLPTGVTLSFTNDNGIISAEATAQCISHGGTHPITLRVTNSAGLTASTTFNVIVNPNLSPTLDNYNNATVIASGTIAVSPSAPPTDLNDNLNSLTVSPESLPGAGWLSVNQTTGVVTAVTFGATQLDTYQIQVEARDTCDFTVRRNFFLTVLNSPPQVASIGNSVLTTQGATSPLAPITIATISDQQDAPGALNVSATAPAGLTVTLTKSNGTITATATCAVAPGTYNATLTVTDSAGATASATFPIIVDPNPPPTLGTYLNSGVTVGGSVLIVPNAPPSDPNNATLTLTVNPPFLPGGGQVTISQGNGHVTVNTVATTTLGTYQVIVAAQDACGAQVGMTFRLTVRSATCITEQGAVFVADTGNHRIQQFNGSTWKVIGPGTQGSGLGQFTFPESVVASPDGRNIYVADTGNRRIQWSQDSGGTWAVFASNLMPQGLVLDLDGNLYVSDAQDNRVARYAGGVSGTPIVLATGGSGAGEVRNPNGLAIDCRMNLYIADTGNNRILVIATADAAVLPNTGTVVAGSGAGPNPALVTAPQGVAVDNAGKLYVADTGNDRVLMIASAPAPGAATVLCTLGPALGQVRGPEGVTVAAFAAGPLAGASSIVVSDTTNNRIQGSKLPAGAWMLLPPPVGGGPGTGMGQFKLPSKIR